jgi:hypothetical protein
MNKRPKIRSTNSRTHNKANASKVHHANERRNGLTQASIIPRTALDRRLFAIRRKILASGQPLFDWHDIENEVRDRRREATKEPTS